MGVTLEPVDGNPARYTESGLAEHLDRLLHLLAGPETPLGRLRLGPAVAPRGPVWRDRDATPVPRPAEERRRERQDAGELRLVGGVDDPPDDVEEAGLKWFGIGKPPREPA